MCGYDQSRESVCPLALFKVFGGLSPLQRSKVRQTFVSVVPPPLFFLLPCYLNFQTSALMSIVGTSRGLLAHRAGVGFSEKARASAFFQGERRGSHTFLPEHFPEEELI